MAGVRAAAAVQEHGSGDPLLRRWVPSSRPAPPRPASLPAPRLAAQAASSSGAYIHPWTDRTIQKRGTAAAESQPGPAREASSRRHHLPSPSHPTPSARLPIRPPTTHLGHGLQPLAHIGIRAAKRGKLAFAVVAVHLRAGQGVGSQRSGGGGGEGCSPRAGRGAARADQARACCGEGGPAALAHSSHAPPFDHPPLSCAAPRLPLKLPAADGREGEQGWRARPGGPPRRQAHQLADGVPVQRLNGHGLLGGRKGADLLEGQRLQPGRRAGRRAAGARRRAQRLLLLRGSPGHCGARYPLQSPPRGARRLPAAARALCSCAAPPLPRRRICPSWAPAGAPGPGCRPAPAHPGCTPTAGAAWRPSLRCPASPLLSGPQHEAWSPPHPFPPGTPGPNLADWRLTLRDALATERSIAAVCVGCPARVGQR